MFRCPGPKDGRDSKISGSYMRVRRCGRAAPRRVANEHLNDAGILSITSYTPRYGTKKMKLDHPMAL